MEKISMGLVELKKDGDIFIITMHGRDNRLNNNFLEAMHRALDAVEKSSGSAALVTTGREPKFYSNGLDLAWLAGDGSAERPRFISAVSSLYARFLTFPIPTVAAINGHAFAAGLMMAMAHDFRIMRADRGFVCMPEVDIKVPLVAGHISLIRSHVSSPDVFRDLLLAGVRMGGEVAQKAGIVDEAVPGDQVLPRAIFRAAAMANKDRWIYRILKESMYSETLALLRTDHFDLSQLDLEKYRT
jgi:enoyl-CoA hydratase/carnithine racemase